PQPVIARVEAESAKILARSDIRERFSVMGIDVAPLPPAQLAAFQKSELAKWARLVRTAGIEPQ
ncbi:MAG: tripartite tricarboxylate transporter substrate binding protein, partial [Burkholderiales bacterium]